MELFRDEKSVCTKCNIDMQQKDTKPEQLDNNTKSLMLMFRIREVILLECPCCGQRGMRI